MAWWQYGERDSGKELVAEKRGRAYATIDHETWRDAKLQRQWRATLFTGHHAFFDTEAEAETWVRASLDEIVQDLSNIEEL